MFLHDIRMLHVVVAKTRLSAGLMCDNTPLDSIAYALNICCMAPYLAVNVLRGDDTFDHPSFCNNVSSIGVTLERIPPQRHQNVLEIEHGIIRSICICLKQAELNKSNAILATMVIDASN